MFSELSVGQLCGILLLFILITSALSQSLAGAVLNAADVPGTLSKVAASDKKFRIGVVIDLISHVSVIALAGLLYIAFSPYGQPLALIGTLWRVTEGTIVALGEVNNFVLLAVAQKFNSATGAVMVTLETLGRTRIVAEESGLKIGLTFFAFGHLAYAILFVSSGAVPSVLGWWGVVASFLAVAGILLAFINPNVSSVIKSVSFFPIILYEVALGIWLLLRGGQIGQL